MLANASIGQGLAPLSQSAGIALRPLRQSDLRKLRLWWTRTVPSVERRVMLRSDARWNLWFERRGPDCNDNAITSHGKLIGYCGWNDHNEVLIFIGPLELRSQGIGTRAMRHLFYQARIMGKRRLSATTKTAIDFFIKLGFRELHTTCRLTEADRAAGRICLGWGK